MKRCMVCGAEFEHHGDPNARICNRLRCLRVLLERARGAMTDETPERAMERAIEEIGCLMHDCHPALGRWDVRSQRIILKYGRAELAAAGCMWRDESVTDAPNDCPEYNRCGNCARIAEIDRELGE